jgi:hypothetical protein
MRMIGYNYPIFANIVVLKSNIFYALINIDADTKNALISIDVVGREKNVNTAVNIQIIKNISNSANTKQF